MCVIRSDGVVFNSAAKLNQGVRTERGRGVEALYFAIELGSDIFNGVKRHGFLLIVIILGCSVQVCIVARCCSYLSGFTPGTSHI